MVALPAAAPIKERSLRREIGAKVSDIMFPKGAKLERKAWTV
jgi:hypothetical protein